MKPVNTSNTSRISYYNLQCFRVTMISSLSIAVIIADKKNGLQPAKYLPGHAKEYG